MGADEAVRVESQGPRLVVSFDSPGSKNALSTAELDTIDAALAKAAEDSTIRLMVIRSAVDGVFCAGADLRELQGFDRAAAEQFTRRGQAVFRRIETSSKPVIAVVDGFALGGGLELCLASALMICSSRSRFGLPEAKLGLIPGFGGTQRLTRAIGRQKALRIMLTGELLSAEEMSRLGLLADEPSAPDALDEDLDALCQQIENASPSALASILRSTATALDASMSTGLQLESWFALAAQVSDDGQEGMAAFLGKRDPAFLGLTFAATDELA